MALSGHSRTEVHSDEATSEPQNKAGRIMGLLSGESTKGLEDYRGGRNDEVVPWATRRDSVQAALKPSLSASSFPRRMFRAAATGPHSESGWQPERILSTTSAAQAAETRTGARTGRSTRSASVNLNSGLGLPGCRSAGPGPGTR
eukprot:574081-Rhodomonas_salina.1